MVVREANMARIGSLRNYKKIHSDDKSVKQLQENIEQTNAILLNTPPIDGVLLKEIALDSTTINNIEHKLGRKLLGWTIVRQRASAIIWDTQDANIIPGSFLALNCSANVTVDIWVF